MGTEKRLFNFFFFLRGLLIEYCKNGHSYIFDIIFFSNKYEFKLLK